MRRLEFITCAFRDGTSRAESHEILSILLRTLVDLNVSYLRHHPHGVPGLMAGHVRYQREPEGYEQWMTIPQVILQGHADCEDLAAYRIAWLKVRCGIDAWPCFKWRQTGSLLTYHIIVCRADGVLEDPSRVLGMGWDEQWKKAPIAFPHPNAVIAPKWS